MITVDTNVLARLAIDDNAQQTKDARDFVAAARGVELIYIPLVTLVETVWMFRKYKMPRSVIVQAITKFVESSDFVVGQRELVLQALAWYKSGKADFADYLIHAEGAAAGAKTLVTFDEAFAQEDKKRRKHPKRWKP